MNSKDRSYSRALQLQKKIYTSLKKQVHQILGPTPKAILQYESENQNDFRISGRTSRIISKSELIEAVQNADVSFIGDYHTLARAQRTALNIISHAIKKNHTKWYIGIEFISSQFQRELDQFQAGELTLERFHELISYNESWGFPWKNYEPLFTWARENQIEMIALNRPKIGFHKFLNQRELFQRDQWAAGIITDLFHDTPKVKPKLICLFGELHIGSLHLPMQLKKISKVVLKQPLHSISIYQTEDRLYWKTAEQYRDVNTQAIQINSQVYSVFTSTPWAKLQSLLVWAEGSLTDTANEQEVDYLSLFQNDCQLICEFFKISLPSLDSISIATIGTVDFKKIFYSKKFSWSALEKKLIRYNVQNNIRFFISKVNIAYLGVPSSNRIAELAGIFLFQSHVKPFRSKETQQYNLNCLLMEAVFGFFCSLILNPKRKCDQLFDHQRIIKKLQRTKRESFSGELLARKFTIDFLCRPKKNPDLFRTEMQKLSVAEIGSPFVATKYIGHILGKALYQAMISGDCTMETVRLLFLENQDIAFSERTAQLMSIVLKHMPLKSERQEAL